MFPLFVWKLFPLFPREIKPKKLDTEPVRSQLRGDFLLGRDQAEWERMPVSRGAKEWDLSDRGARK